MNFFEPEPDGFHARFAVALAAEETAEPGNQVQGLVELRGRRLCHVLVEPVDDGARSDCAASLLALQRNWSALLPGAQLMHSALYNIAPRYRFR
jgi:hypothetical protein